MRVAVLFALCVPYDHTVVYDCSPLFPLLKLFVLFALHVLLDCLHVCDYCACYVSSVRFACVVCVVAF